MGLKDFPSIVSTSRDVDRITELLLGIIQRAYHKKSRVLKIKNTDVPWWNAKLEKLRDKVNRALRKAKSSSPQRKDALFRRGVSINEP